MLSLLNNLNPLGKKQSLNIRLGLWGTIGSGKTTYLAMLLHCLEKEKNHKWIVTPDEQFRYRVRENITQIIDKKRFPLPTSTQLEKIQIFSYNLMPRNLIEPRNSNIILRFIDAPGEFYENLNIEVKVIDQENEYCDIVDYLMSCDGIIFFTE